MFFHYIDEEKISLRYEIPFVPIIVVENPFMCSYIFPLISYKSYKSFIYSIDMQPKLKQNFIQHFSYG